MDVEDMMAAIEHSNTSENRLRQISEKPFWRQELDRFVDIIKGYKIASFYETELTRRLKQACNFHHFTEPLLTVTAT
jgi:hypothetical protein